MPFAILKLQSLQCRMLGDPDDSQSCYTGDRKGNAEGYMKSFRGGMPESTVAAEMKAGWDLNDMK